MSKLSYLIGFFLIKLPIVTWGSCPNLEGIYSAMNGSKTASMRIEQIDCDLVKLSLGSFMNGIFHEEFDIGEFVAEGKQDLCEGASLKCPSLKSGS